MVQVPKWSNGPDPIRRAMRSALCALRVLYWFSFKLGGAQAEPLDSLVAQSASGKGFSESRRHLLKLIRKRNRHHHQTEPLR